MARIRSIKPEFFDSPSTAACSPWARLLYIAMWCMADDWGVGSANLKELAAFAFPNDDQWTSKELPSLCKEVADNYGVEFYTNRGRPYYAIISWEEHQVTQRRSKRRNPPPDDPESVPDLRFQDMQGTSLTVTRNFLDSDKEDASTEQGNRGTGEQGNRGTGERPTVVRSTRTQHATEVSTPETTQTIVGEWIDHCAKRPPGRIIGQVAREVKTLLDEGIPYPDVRAGLAAWQEKGLNPATIASVVHEVRNPPRRARPTTDDRVREGLELAQRLEENYLPTPQIGA